MNDFDITADDVGRVLWLLAALFGLFMVTLTLRAACKDYRAVEGSDASKGDRIVARMLGKREVLLWFTQFVPIAVAVAALILPEFVSARQVALIISSLTVGMSSICWWHDRRQFQEQQRLERSKDVSP